MSRSFTVYIASLVCFLALLLSCTDEPTAPPPPGSGDTLAVTVVEVAPTFLTLRLHVNSAGEYRLDRDGQTAWSGSITPPDTVITDLGLLPATEYHFTLSHIIDGGVVSTSPMTTARTGDTVSHEFVWEVDTLFWPGTSQPAFFWGRGSYASSVDNVFLVGYSTDLRGMCWRWQGDGWNMFDISKYLTNEVSDIDGIDSTYIVFLGMDPSSPRFNFSNIATLDNGVAGQLPLPYGTKRRTCLHVVARNEIYMGGEDGIQRYNGVKWEWLLDTTESEWPAFFPEYIHKFDDGTLEFVTQGKSSKERPSTRFLWRWNVDRFIVIDSFTVVEKDLSKIRFGYRIYRSDAATFSTGIGGTYQWKANGWEKIHTEGGLFIAGELNDLMIGANWTYFWHYNGSTKKNLWGELKTIMPPLRKISAAIFRDGELFICGELEGTQYSVVFHGKQQ